jgi:phosphoribosylanthranilate isomerase
MREDDVQMCAIYGADIIGFVVEYPHPVPWNLSVAEAKKLVSQVKNPTGICVVTGGTPEKIIRIADETKPDYIQLHSGESLKDTAFLVKELRKRRIKVIKTLFPDTPDLLNTAKEFAAAGVWALLYDPRKPDDAANGGDANLSVHSKLRQAVRCPVILAGGIKPENAAEIISAARPQVIDLMTGVERRHGEKDENKVRALFREIDRIATELP